MKISMAVLLLLGASVGSGAEGIALFFGSIALVVVLIVVVLRAAVGKSGKDSPPIVSQESPDPYREKFHEKAAREARRAQEPPEPRATILDAMTPEQKYAALIREELLVGNSANRPDDSDAAEAEFERIIAETVPAEAQAKSFYTKVAGTSHRNSDGTLRSRIIDECSLFESLELRPEPENEFDPNAIAVRRWETGEQLGYLEARLAGEIARDQVKHGPRWIAAFRRKSRHPETGRVVGAVLYMIRLTDEYVNQKEAERPGSIIKH